MKVSQLFPSQMYDVLDAQWICNITTIDANKWHYYLFLHMLLQVRGLDTLKMFILHDSITDEEAWCFLKICQKCKDRGVTYYSGNTWNRILSKMLTHLWYAKEWSLEGWEHLVVQKHAPFHSPFLSGAQEWLWCPWSSNKLELKLCKLDSSSNRKNIWRKLCCWCSERM